MSVDAMPVQMPTAASPLTPAHDGRGVTRVLLVEDNPADAELVVDYFDGAAPQEAAVVVERADRLATAVARVARERFDVVLLDLSLPDAHGLEGLAALTAAAPDVPVVVMTGLADDAMALAALHAGAQDYLIKGEDGGRVVRRAVRYAVERHRLRREREALLARERGARADAERAARVRDEVLGIVSHDLRSPLGTIVMSAHALQEDVGPGTAERADHVGIIVRSAEWALRVIRDLLDVTAIEAGRLAIHREPMTVQAITDMIRSLYEVPARAAGVELTIAITDAPRWIEADVDRTVQAVGNLVSNALAFTPRGGRVALTVARAPGTGAGDAVAFRVADTGPGIAPEHLPHLFDRFWQARTSHRAGAGLGLAIARGIAEGHGGRIEVESTPGAGSVFTLVLPAGA